MIGYPSAGQDHEIQAGVGVSQPTSTDNGDGTIRDNLTVLISLKNANCMEGILNWSDALLFANSLKSGDCGLSDGSMEGDTGICQT